MTDEAILTEPAVPNKRRQPLAVIPHVYLAWVPANALNQNLQLPPTGEVDGCTTWITVLCFDLKTVLLDRELKEHQKHGAIR